MIPDIFTLTQDILDIGEGAENALIHNLGKFCKCVSESQNRTVCNNCIYNPITQQSTGRYNGGGPKPFTSGICPVCYATGFIPGSENAEVIVQLLINWTPKVNRVIADRIKVPYDLVLVKGFAGDLPSVAQSKFIVLDYMNNKYNGNKFVLFSEPIDPNNIIKNRYFECYLQKYVN